MNTFELFFVIVIITTVTLFTQNVRAQEASENKIGDFSVSGEIASNYIWRGMDNSKATLSFQPAVNYSIKNFSIGAWGSSDIQGITKEIDLTLSYSVNGFSATLTDYFWTTDKKYFNFKNESTGHNIEMGFSYENKKIPLKLYAGTMIWGEDKKMSYDTEETDAEKSNYSTYIELSYTLNIKESSLNIFAGATPFTGMYGNDFAVIYTGITGSKDIKITDKFSLPFFATFSANPQTEEYFLIFGIKL